MTHATDGLLQAFLDGEIDGKAAAELNDHLAGCAACAAELDALRGMAARVSASLALLPQAPAPLLRARAALAAERRGVAPRASRLSRLGTAGLAKAAMLLLVLAGAAAAAIPGSPVRRALETTIARVAELFRDAEPPVAEAPPAAPVVDEPAPLFNTAAAVLPADGRVRVVLHAPARDTEVTVRLVADARARVETATIGGDVRFRTGGGRIEVAGLSPGSITIEIPATAQHATIEIDGRVHAYKEGAALHLTGPAGRGSGARVSFRTGT